MPLHWFFSLALAQVPEPATLEVVVVAERRLSETKEGLHRSLKDQGYVRLWSLGERSWYLNRQLWKPGVMVHEQGFARVRGHPVIPLPIPSIYQTPDGTTVYEMTAITQGRRKVQSQRDAVIGRLEPYLRDLRDGQWALAQGQRRIELQVELSRLWFDGVAPDGLYLPEWDARRAALAARFRATAPDEPGQWARDLIEAFVDAEVQTSEHPFEAEERERLFSL